MVEIEIGVMVSQCLDRRIATKEILTSEIAACELTVDRASAAPRPAEPSGARLRRV